MLQNGDVVNAIRVEGARKKFPDFLVVPALGSDLL
jgi:hypothetical protein